MVSIIFGLGKSMFQIIWNDLAQHD